ncbi:MAG TPA: enoyl-CoA hydratase-related protein [Gemmatimonadaceae bacterium]
MSIEVARDGHVAVLTLNRPERLNALDGDHYAALADAWKDVRDDSTIRAAVVTGSGDRSFSVGADLKSFIPDVQELGEFWLTQQGQLLNRGLEVWKPIVAAVNGYCLGGGLTLLLATDVRVAASHATFGLPEVKRGLIPANGGTQRLVQQIPFARAMEMLLTGESIDAATALDWGLVNRVVAKEELVDVALDCARRIAANAPLAVQSAKELAYRSRDVDLATGLRLEQAMARLLRGSADAKEGADAFSEKRPPDFTGA